ncbi:MAG: sulfite exporter TauE/SafE family protein [Gluconacetobacter diazotrophicus]|nr:sulfite exporter TauE/SafE family protein [Gluconacetobacter diazotrophicus]
MNPGQAAFIAGAGVLAGIINSVAGGGSFFTLPALVRCGVPTVQANTTSTVALWPGTMASFGAYRQEMASRRRMSAILALVSILGGGIGAWILLHTPAATFDLLLPWLTLFATLLFTYGRQVAARFKLSLGEHDDARSLVKTSALQFVIAIYGGYYGAGAGIMMLAVLSLLGMTNIHAMNALKTLLSASFNGVAVVIFIARGFVLWPEALTMMAGAVVGGYGGAWLARRLPAAWVRGFVIVTGVLTTIYFFWRLR